MDFSFFELLQLNDATFPIGSYAFSWGLETYVQQGIIHNSESAKNFILAELKGSFLYSELLTARLAYENCNSEKLSNLNDIYGASKAPFELREGSRKLASRFIKTTKNLCSDTNFDLLNKDVQYFPVVYGAYCAKRRIPLEQAIAAFIYSQVSARVTTCVKLVPLSQNDGQEILYSLMKEFSQLITECLKLTEHDLCRSCPGLDVRAMQHEFLYSRLYSN